ncbi:hypothetical protein FIBSPDRAFT_896270 [Athelia psychrophila]|uniref:Uncharacterized protein n=1 Tax=Athelia psychrophila TaxID=1759441 RepID=A0A166DIP2_9AGAM|nr:hypothetical protein FIBSPDRAFT_896270 [Fibularhizoctonia sp. CBS 109695]
MCGSTTLTARANEPPSDEDHDPVEELASIKDDLERACEENRQLHEQLQEACHSKNTPDESEMVPKLTGRAGSDYGIQDKMGLRGSGKRYDKLDWTRPWKEIPLRDKATLFDVNRKQNHYSNGWLKVPAKYEYLKQNSLKRDQSESHRKKAFGVEEARKAREKRKAQQRNKPEDDSEDEQYKYSDEDEMDVEDDVNLNKLNYVSTVDLDTSVARQPKVTSRH